MRAKTTVLIIVLIIATTATIVHSLEEKQSQSINPFAIPAALKKKLDAAASKWVKQVKNAVTKPFSRAGKFKATPVNAAARKSFITNQLQRYAFLSMLVYCKPANTLKTPAKCACTMPKSFNKQNAYPQEVAVCFNSKTNNVAIVGVAKPFKEIVVVFRGTEVKTNNGKFDWKARNLLQDLYGLTEKDGVQQRLPGMPKNVIVHKGFYQAYGNVRACVHRNVKKLWDKYSKQKYTRVVSIGHSLGGAMAGICAADLIGAKLVPPKYVHLMTTGSPRFTNAEGVKWLSKQLGLPSSGLFGARSYRMVFQNDPIPHMPRTRSNVKVGVLARYHHIGREVWIEGKFSKIRVCNTNGEDKTGAVQVNGGWAFGDHFGYACS